MRDVFVVLSFLECFQKTFVLLHQQMCFMEDIRIYHTLWKNLVFLIFCFVFVTICFWTIKQGSTQELNLISWKEPTQMLVWISWAGVVFFGCGGLLYLYFLLKEFITHTPFYIITSDAIKVCHGLKPYEIRFADVESFFLTSVTDTKIIGIKYNRDAEIRKQEDSNAIVRLIRGMNKKVSGTSEALGATGLSVKPQQLCDLLNEHLYEYQKRQPENMQKSKRASFAF